MKNGPRFQRPLGRLNSIYLPAVAGAGGPCYQWTRKVKGKSVSVALSKEQYEALREAIEHWRQLQVIRQEMQG
jgi:hypothetical protein